MRRILTMVSLVFAGDAASLLPYFLRRDYAKAMQATMGLSATELGTLSSVFGVLAMLSYFPGGWLADRMSTRNLLTFSLLSTGAGGFFMLTTPSYPALIGLYAFWGISSILFFWAALVKATRAWGGQREQGRAFGILEGGRGLTGASLSLAALGLFSLGADSVAGLHNVIWLYTLASLAAGVLTFLVVPEDEASANGREPQPAHKKTTAGHLTRVLRMPIVWLQTTVILTAYFAYWGTYDIATFAVDGYGRSEVFGASVSTFGVWLRPVAAVGAGLLADKISTARTVQIAFLILVTGGAAFAIAPANSSFLWLLWANTAMISAACFALRGIYYALLEEGAVPMVLTGTAVGVVSVLGYTPDIFAPVLIGWLNDTYPGATGHRILFGIIAITSLGGLMAARTIQRRCRTRAP